MRLEGWRVLRAGHGRDVVLSVDFTQAKVRAQATFTDLAGALPEEYPVWGTDETGWPAAGGDPRAQLEAWLERSLGVADSVRGVLGFCAGAGPACALARRLTAVRGVAPRLVLFNPAVVAAPALLDQFEASLTSMAAMAGEDELRAARDGARADAGLVADAVDALVGVPGSSPAADPVGGPAGLADLAARLLERYSAVARPVCEARGVPAAIADQLCQRVGVHLRYLAMCAVSGDLAGPAGDGGALVVHSADHVVPARVRIARRLRLDASHVTLLADPAAARATAGALSTVPVTGRA